MWNEVCNFLDTVVVMEKALLTGYSLLISCQKWEMTARHGQLSKITHSAFPPARQVQHTQQGVPALTSVIQETLEAWAGQVSSSLPNTMNWHLQTYQSKKQKG
ncbi:MAG: hypothetical protein U0231_01735 [Nitrospiraceae bacterium]